MAAKGGYSGISELESLEESFRSWGEGKARLLRGYLEGREVADLGCGTGVFSSLISRQGGFRVGCFDSDARLVKAARARGLDAWRLDLADSKAVLRFRSKFDSAMLLDVIEHVESPGLVLKNAGKMLKPGGVLVVSVPAFGFLFSSLDRKIGHYRRYTAGSLRRSLEESGFDVEDVRYWNVPGVFGWLAVCTILGRSISSVKSPLVDSLYSAWLPVEEGVRFPFGLSVVAKARVR